MVTLVVAVATGAGCLLLGFVVGWQTRGHLAIARRPSGEMVRIPPAGRPS